VGGCVVSYTAHFGPLIPHAMPPWAFGCVAVGQLPEKWVATGEGCAGVICKAVGGVNPLVEYTALPRSAVAMGRSTYVSGKSEFGCATCLMRLSVPSSEGAVGEGAGTSSTSFRPYAQQLSSGTGFRRCRCCDCFGRFPSSCRPCWRLPASSRSPPPETYSFPSSAVLRIACRS
jgi:hypothetical protein